MCWVCFECDMQHAGFAFWVRNMHFCFLVCNMQGLCWVCNVLGLFWVQYAGFVWSEQLVMSMQLAMRVQFAMWDWGELPGNWLKAKRPVLCWPVCHDVHAGGHAAGGRGLGRPRHILCLTRRCSGSIPGESTNSYLFVQMVLESRHRNQGIAIKALQSIHCNWALSQGLESRHRKHQATLPELI